MEDQERDMAPNGDEKESISTVSSRPSDLTVMIIGKVGKFRSFRISARVFFWASLFFLSYIVASVLVFNEYFDERRTNRFQSELLEQLQNDINNAKRELHRTRQHLAFLEEAVHDRELNREKPAEPVPAEVVIPEKQRPADDSGPVEKVEKILGESPVKVEDLAVKEDGTTLTVTFRLVNARKDENPVNGYVHMIVMDKASDPPQLWSYPKVAMRDGIPVNYKRGQIFFIKRFKTIRGEYFLDSKTDVPLEVTVLVYDQSGTLILKKGFEVKNDT